MKKVTCTCGSVGGWVGRWGVDVQKANKQITPGKPQGVYKRNGTDQQRKRETIKEGYVSKRRLSVHDQIRSAGGADDKMDGTYIAQELLQPPLPYKVVACDMIAPSKNKRTHPKKKNPAECQVC